VNCQWRQPTFTFPVARTLSISAHVSERLGGLTANLVDPSSFFGSRSIRPSSVVVGAEIASFKVYRRNFNCESTFISENLRPVNEILDPLSKIVHGHRNLTNQIVVIQSSVLQRLIERLFDTTRMVPRKLRGHKELLPRYPTLPDCFTDCMLSAIYLRCVDVPVASL
jgi:hypothetical protein